MLRVGPGGVAIVQTGHYAFHYSGGAHAASIMVDGELIPIPINISSIIKTRGLVWAWVVQFCAGTKFTEVP